MTTDDRMSDAEMRTFLGWIDDTIEKYQRRIDQQAYLAASGEPKAAKRVATDRSLLAGYERARQAVADEIKKGRR